MRKSDPMPLPALGEAFACLAGGRPARTRFQISPTVLERRIAVEIDLNKLIEGSATSFRGLRLTMRWPHFPAKRMGLRPFSFLLTCLAALPGFQGSGQAASVSQNLAITVTGITCSAGGSQLW